MHEEVWVPVPPGDPAFVEGKRMCRRLAKWVPGTKSAPRGWFDTVARKLWESGWVQSKLDPCLFYWRSEGQDAADFGELLAYLPLHVDDSLGRVVHGLSGELEQSLKQVFDLGEFEWIDDGMKVTFCGVTQTELPDCVESEQLAYVDSMQQAPLDKQRSKRREAEATPDEVSSFRTVQGQSIWCTTNTRPECSYETSVGASSVNRLKIGDIVRANKLVRHLHQTPQVLRRPRLPPGNVKVVVVTDAGEGEQNRDDFCRAQGGKCVGLMLDTPSPEPGWMWLVEVRSGKLARVTHNSFDAESIIGVEGLDAGMAVAKLVEEFKYGPTPTMRDRAMASLPPRPRVKVELQTDSNSLVTHVASIRMDPRLAKRRRQDVADVKEAIALGDIYPLVFIRGLWNIMDPLTKCRSRTKLTMQELIKVLTTGWYAPPLG